MKKKSSSFRLYLEILDLWSVKKIKNTMTPTFSLLNQLYWRKFIFKKYYFNIWILIRTFLFYEYALSPLYRKRRFRSLSPVQKFQTDAFAATPSSISCSRAERDYSAMDITGKPQARTLYFSKDYYSKRVENVYLFCLLARPGRNSFPGKCNTSFFRNCPRFAICSKDKNVESPNKFQVNKFNLVAMPCEKFALPLVQKQRLVGLSWSLLFTFITFRLVK